MVFGSTDAVKAALDARDGITSTLLTNTVLDGRHALSGFRGAVERA